MRISPTPEQDPKTFGEWFAKFKSAVSDLLEDLAEQHKHYRLGTQTMKVFVDTFALIAWLNPSDNAHTVVTTT